jgi:hypothetical protein
MEVQFGRKRGDLGHVDGLPAGCQRPGDPPGRASAHLIGLRGDCPSAPQVTVGPFSHRDGSARGARTVTGVAIAKSLDLEESWDFSHQLPLEK